MIYEKEGMERGRKVKGKVEKLIYSHGSLQCDDIKLYTITFTIDGIK